MLKLIPLFPLIGFLINGLGYVFSRKYRGHWLAGTIASLAILASFVISLKMFFELTDMEFGKRIIEERWFSWIKVGSLNVDVSLRLDQLSSLFCLFITGVGSLIHIYSLGYMSNDASPRKFFAYLNLFCFAMLVLVLGSTLPVMFFGWEGVGLCSYLLIGYWYEDNANASAGKKAFVVNRIGDLGIILAVCLLYWSFGTVDYLNLKNSVTSTSTASIPVMWICLLLFAGCVGKSAQIPLYIWLPDAMAGPTPVSALIHAATMVTSGVYLVSRMSFLFVLSPETLEVVAWTGAITAFFAATIATAQNDIKKVLAYSTISQIGYMFLGCGVGAFSAGVFHVVTHAFFKALLFLGAGSVIVGMHHEQDIKKMGGLKKYMPRTYIVFAIGWLSICGIPPFSGFFSKDHVLWKAFSSTEGSAALWVIGLVTAFLTALYMTRLFSLVFLGEYNPDDKSTKRPHESPAVMIIPLIILAILSAVGGFIGLPHLSWMERWLEPIMPVESMRQGVEDNIEWILMAASIFVALLGILIGLKLFARREKKAESESNVVFGGIHKILQNKWYIDEIYDAVIVRPLIGLSKSLWHGIDDAVIDRFILGVGRFSEYTGQTIRVLQNGLVQFYTAMILMGLVLMLGYMIYGMV